MCPIISGGATPGGSSTSVTATVTTSPVTFTAAHTFDLAGYAMVRIRETLIGTVPDGETFGAAVGEICVLIEGVEVSADGAAWFSVSTAAGAFPLFWTTQLDNVDANGNASSVGQYEDRAFPTPRYVRFTVGIGDDASNPYAGPNHPTATLRMDVTALTT